MLCDCQKNLSILYIELTLSVLSERQITVELAKSTVYLLLLVIVITVLFPITSCYVMAHAAYGFVWFFVFGMRPHCCVSLIYCMHSAL